MRKEDCIFCKIANGDIPSATVYEDEFFRGILDIAPAAGGHVILLPKNHAADAMELPEEEAQRIFPVARKVAAAVKKATGCAGINILQNNGKAAGQTVFHFHMHVIPRNENDSVNVGWKPGEYAEGESAEMAERIKAAL